MQMRFEAGNAYKHRVASLNEVNSDMAANFRDRILCPDTFSHRNALEQPSEAFQQELTLAIEKINEKMIIYSILKRLEIHYDRYIAQAMKCDTSRTTVIQPVDFPDLVLDKLTRDILFGSRGGFQVDDNSFFRPITPTDIDILKHHMGKLGQDTRLAFTDLFQKK